MSFVPLQTVIVLIDDDPALLDVLADLVRAPGRVVDTITGGDGLTVDLIALSQPHLVVFNPRTGGLPDGDVSALVRGVRAATGARFVLMLSEDDAQHAGALTRALSADAAIPIPVLLRDPLVQLVEPAAAATAPAPLSTGLAGLSVDDILNLDFDAPPAPAPRAPRSQPPQTFSSPSSLLQTSAPARRVASFIEEELSKAVSEPRPAVRYDVTLDTLGVHGLYSGADGVLRGVVVATLFPPPPGTEVRVQLTLPWGARFEVTGKVDWAQEDTPFRRRRGAVGVALTMEPAVRAALERLAALRRPIVVA